MSAPFRPAPDADHLDALARIALDEAGLNLPPTKHPMMRARLRRRMAETATGDLAAYRRLVESPGGAEERARMVAALTTHVSHYFREPHHFQTLRERVLPPLIERARRGGRVRLWSAGCARGQEAYSIALTLIDMMPEAPRFDIRILATDLDPAVIAAARQPRLDPDDRDRIAPHQRNRYLQEVADGLTVSPALGGLVRFEVQNLHRPFPADSQFDVIFCRNVLIYFSKSGYEEVLLRLAGCLPPGGWLFLGHSERISGPACTLFSRAGRTSFQRADADPFHPKGSLR